MLDHSLYDKSVPTLLLLHFFFWSVKLTSVSKDVY